MDVKTGDRQLAGWVKNPGANAEITIRNDVPIPKPAEDQVLIKLECTGICHSDFNRIYDDKPLITPLCEHEGVGRVVAAGTDVPKDFMNRRVGIGWLYSACHNCEIYTVDYTACPEQHNAGPDVPEYIVAPAKFVTPIPHKLPSEVAAPLLCAGVAMYSAIQKAALKPDYDWKSLCEDEDLAFAWMACGFTYEEMMDKTADLTWFINPDKNARVIAVDHHAAKTNGTNGVNGTNGLKSANGVNGVTSTGINGTKPQDPITVQ